MGLLGIFLLIMISSLILIFFTKDYIKVVCSLVFAISVVAVIVYTEEKIPKVKTIKVENTITTFVEEYSEYISSTPLKVVKITPVESLPDGCHIYSVILINFDSTYTYSAVLDPEDFEVINFYLEESIPRLKFI